MAAAIFFLSENVEKYLQVMIFVIQYKQKICKEKTQMKKFFEDFKKFITRGNVIDMAVGVIVGGAFTAIVTSLTNNIIRPFINWLLAVITGGSGLDSVFTFLKKVEVTDALGNTTVDLAKSIYIDWGALITAIIDFFIIAFVIFSVVRIINKSKDMITASVKEVPTRQERKELKALGVNMKDWNQVKVELKKLRASKIVPPAPAPEKTEDILKDIRALLKEQAAKNVETTEVKE